MNKHEAQKVFNDFQYLIGAFVDYMPTKPSITHLTIDEITINQFEVRIHAENPHPSIGNSYNDFIQIYCRKVGIEYTFPESL